MSVPVASVTLPVVTKAKFTLTVFVVKVLKPTGTPSNSVAMANWLVQVAKAIPTGASGGVVMNAVRRQASVAGFQIELDGW